MRRAITCVVFAVIACISHAEDITRNVPRVGGLCVLESDEPVTWVTAHPEIETFATKDGLACFVDTSDPRPRIILAIHGAPTGTAPAVDRYRVLIGDSTPPGPQPNPNPGPQPEPQPPQGFAAWVTARANELIPADEKKNITTAVQVYRDAAQAAGTEVWTGPAIRLWTNGALLRAIPSITKWAKFLESLDASNGEWAREAYRDAAAYRQRWVQIAEGLAAATATRGEVSSSPPHAVAVVEIKWLPRTHQIRNGRLLEYVCEPGQRCRWVDRGAVVSRDIRDDGTYLTVANAKE